MGTATITEWDAHKWAAVTDGQAVSLTVDFDPQSLELSYQTTGRPAALDAAPTTSKNKVPAQNTGQSSTLSLTLMFDTTTEHNVSVQTRTDPLILLTQPRDAQPKSSGTGTPRVIRFQWGSFLYFGTVASMSQTIDFFSDSGIPLRASVHLTVNQVNPPDETAGAGATSGASASAGVGFGAGVGIGASLSASASFGASADAGVGTTPLTLSLDGDSVQGIAARAGGAVSWKAVAAANNIDNPRLLPPGTVLSTSPTASASFRASAG